jgi:hypothetical protein
LAKSKHLGYDIPTLLQHNSLKHTVEIKLLALLSKLSEFAGAVELFIDRHIQ